MQLLIIYPPTEMLSRPVFEQLGPDGYSISPRNKNYIVGSFVLKKAEGLLEIPENSKSTLDLVSHAAVLCVVWTAV